jgi:hypothetical protein
LQTRLIRRGFAPAAAAAVLESATEAAEVPGSVARAVAKSAVAFLSNQPTAGVVPAAAAVLAEGVLHTMFVTKLKWAVAVLALVVLGSGAGVATYDALAGDGPVAKAGQEKKDPPADPLAARLDPPKGGAPAKAMDEQPPPAEAGKLTDHTIDRLCDFLQRRVTIDKPIENAPLRDVLEFLSDKYGLTFIVDTQAFEQAGVGGGRNVEDSQVRLPKMPGVNLAAILRFLTAQVDGTYLIRRDFIEITTRHRQVLEAFGPGVESSTLNPPTVNVAFQGRSLEKALADVAVQSGKNIVLDPRVADKEKLVVTAQLLNTPIDAAVRVLADMVGLQAVTMENVYYVTTPENADRLDRQQRARETGEPTAPDKVTPPNKAPKP